MVPGFQGREPLVHDHALPRETDQARGCELDHIEERDGFAVRRNRHEPNGLKAGFRYPCAMRLLLLAAAFCVSLPACGGTNGSTGGSGGAPGAGGTAGEGGSGGLAGEGGSGGSAGAGGTAGATGAGGTAGAGGAGGTAGAGGTGGAAGAGGTGGNAGAGGTGGNAGVGGAAGAGGTGGQGGDAGPLPDLTATVSNVYIALDTTVSAADLLEGCASASSGIDLVRFSGTTNNLGPADVVVGDPGCPNCERNPLAVCDNPNFICAPAEGHGHGHYQNFASYELLDETGQNVVAQGHKQGFCLRDTNCTFGSPTFSCHFQGLTAGCSDVYSHTLGCQYIEITDVPGGDYLVRMTSDPLNLFEEANETNNSHSVPVTIPSR